MQTQGRTFLLNAYGDHFDNRIPNQKTSENLEVHPKSVRSSKFEIHRACIFSVVNLKIFAI